jgi:hypothetical protein
MASITSGEVADCDWLRSTFSSPLFSRTGSADHTKKNSLRYLYKKDLGLYKKDLGPIFLCTDLAFV